MPVQKDVHGNNDRQELKTTEEHLMSAQKLLQALRCFGQTKAGPEINGKSRDKQRNRELLECWCGDFATSVYKQRKTEDEDREREDLERKSSQQDVIRCAWILVV